jgi:hypothetical protein
MERFLAGARAAREAQLSPESKALSDEQEHNRARVVEKSLTSLDARDYLVGMEAVEAGMVRNALASPKARAFLDRKSGAEDMAVWRVPPSSDAEALVEDSSCSHGP